MDRTFRGSQGNAQKIGQVVINLLVNACQALTDPEPAIRLTTTYEASDARR